MGSKILSQTFLPIPKTLLPQSTDKFGFSTVLSSRPSSFNSTPITISRVSSTKFHVLPQTKRSLVVRAEPNSEGEVEATADGETEVVALAVADAEAKPPRTPRIKLGDIMGILNKRAIEAADEIRPTPDLRPGDIVEIKLEVPENRRRSSTYKGIVIGKQNAGIHTTIRIRRIIAGVGVEIVFPVYSPNVKMIKVVKHRKVRRAKLYYLRDKLPRLSTFK